ncbi:hydrophobic protein rci2a, partial [Quercus suber]
FIFSPHTRILKKPLYHKLTLAYIYFFFLSFAVKLIKQTKNMGSQTFIEVLLAILLPPMGVFLRYGCGVEFWIDLGLTLLGYIPGIIYAVYVIVR